MLKRDKDPKIHTSVCLKIQYYIPLDNVSKKSSYSQLIEQTLRGTIPPDIALTEKPGTFPLPQ